jgi:phage terminase large subunit
LKSVIEIPQFLAHPPKLRPVIEQFNQYRYFLLEGGRGGGKTQFIARLLTYLAEKKELKIFGGREVQNTVDESVYTVFKDVISTNNLNFDVLATRITHKTTGSEIRFKGFREQGRVNIKGLEGVDILWIDEAQAVSKNTLDIIIPTIRKEKAKVFFSMNRFRKDDAVYKEFATRPDCLHIKINYDENPYCPEALKKEAEMCHPDDYAHIWQGEPLEDASNYLFNETQIAELPTTDFLYDGYGDKAMGVDFARSGSAFNSVVVLMQRGPNHWEECHHEKWRNADTMHNLGRVIDIKSTHRPSVMTCDGDGLGGPICDRLTEQRIDHVEFRGGFTDTPDPKRFKNWRSAGYLTLEDMVKRKQLKIKTRSILEQLLTIKYKFDSTGRKYIMSKEEMESEARREGKKFVSPDDADALMMAVSRCHEVHKQQAVMYQPRRQEYAREEALI